MEDTALKANILVVDDEEDICEILQYNLEKAGFKVKTVLSSEEALSVISSEKFDLLLLDIMMGGISGLKLAQLLREDYKSSVDDYISKPFSVNEVVARVKAVLSRSGRIQKPSGDNSASAWKNNSKGVAARSVPDTPQPADEVQQDYFDFGILTIDAKESSVKVSGEPVLLTRKEMEILLLLARSTGKLFSREEILKNVWKDDGFVLQRTVDVHIARLRKKLGPAGDLVQNRSGFGYCIHPQGK